MAVIKERQTESAYMKRKLWVGGGRRDPEKIQRERKRERERRARFSFYGSLFIARNTRLINLPTFSARAR